MGVFRKQQRLQYQPPLFNHASVLNQICKWPSIALQALKSIESAASPFESATLPAVTVMPTSQPVTTQAATLPVVGPRSVMPTGQSFTTQTTTLPVVGPRPVMPTSQPVTTQAATLPVVGSRPVMPTGQSFTTQTATLPVVGPRPVMPTSQPVTT